MSSWGQGVLTLLMLQKMRRRRTQKKTAMTPVPTRITISMLPLSSEPEWAESRGGNCAHIVRGRGHTLRAAPLLVGTAGIECGQKAGWGGVRGGGGTFHSHAGRGVDAALGVAHTAQIVARVLLAHALDAQPLVRVRQVDSCSEGGGRLSSSRSGALA